VSQTLRNFTRTTDDAYFAISEHFQTARRTWERRSTQITCVKRACVSATSAAAAGVRRTVCCARSAPPCKWFADWKESVCITASRALVFILRVELLAPFVSTLQDSHSHRVLPFNSFLSLPYLLSRGRFAWSSMATLLTFTCVLVIFAVGVLMYFINDVLFLGCRLTSPTLGIVGAACDWCYRYCVLLILALTQ
jgi:hypothetical protein